MQWEIKQSPIPEEITRELGRMNRFRWDVSPSRRSCYADPRNTLQ